MGFGNDNWACGLHQRLSLITSENKLHPISPTRETHHQFVSCSLFCET